MTHPLEKAMRKMKAVKAFLRKYPAHALPHRLYQRALADLITATLCTCSGISEESARAKAKSVCGGRAGRLLVEIVLSEDEDIQGDRK